MITTRLTQNVTLADLVPETLMEVVPGEPVRFARIALDTAESFGSTGNMFWRIGAPAEWLTF